MVRMKTILQERAKARKYKKVLTKKKLTMEGGRVVESKDNDNQLELMRKKRIRKGVLKKGLIIKECFGKIIRENRLRLGFGAVQLSHLLGKGYTYITKIELEGTVPDFISICKMADTLCLNKQELLQMAKEFKISKYEISVEKKIQHILRKSNGN